MLVQWHLDPDVMRYWDGRTFTSDEMAARLARPQVDSYIVEADGETGRLPPGVVRRHRRYGRPRHVPGPSGPGPLARPGCRAYARPLPRHTRGAHTRHSRSIPVERAGRPRLGQSRIPACAGMRAGRGAPSPLAPDGVRRSRGTSREVARGRRVVRFAYSQRLSGRTRPCPELATSSARMIQNASCVPSPGKRTFIPKTPVISVSGSTVTLKIVSSGGRRSGGARSPTRSSPRARRRPPCSCRGGPRCARRRRRCRRSRSRGPPAGTAPRRSSRRSVARSGLMILRYEMISCFTLEMSRTTSWEGPSKSSSSIRSSLCPILSRIGKQ